MEQYGALRARLNQLDYREPFTKDAVELVHRLLSDVVQGTETCRQLKGQLDQALRDHKLALQQLEPLKLETARLTGENNQLHLDLIKSLDDQDAQRARFERVLRTYEKQIADAKFINAQYKAKLAEEQGRTAAARAKAAEVFQRDSQVSRTAPNGDADAHRLQTIDLETGLEPMDPLAGAAAAVRPPAAAEADMVRLAEARNASAAAAAADLRARADELDGELQRVQEQVRKRDAEIERLGTQLEVARSQQFAMVRHELVNSREPSASLAAARPAEKAAQNVDLPQAQQRIGQLEAHVEFLQEHIGELETEAAQSERDRRRHRDSVARQEKAVADELGRERERNAGLVKNLARLEKMVDDLQRLQLQRASSKAPRPVKTTPAAAPASAAAQATALKARVADLTEQLAASRRKLAQSAARIVRLENEQSEHQSELQRARAAVDELRGQLEQAAAQLASPSRTAERPATSRASSAQPQDLVGELNRENWMLRKANELLQTQAEHLRQRQAELADAVGAEAGARSGESAAALAARVQQLEGALGEAAALRRSAEQRVERLVSHKTTLQSQVDALSRERATLLAALTALEAQVAQLHGEAAAAVQASANEDLAGELQKQVLQLKEQYVALEARLVADEAAQAQREAASAERVALAEREAAEAREEAGQAAQRASEALEREREAVSAAEDAQKQADRADERLTEALQRDDAADAARATRQLAEAQNALEVARGETAAAQADARGARERLAHVEKQLEVARAHLREQERDSAALQRRAEAAEAARDQARADITRVNEQARNATADLGAATRERRALTDELRQAAAERDALRGETADARARIGFLEELLRRKDDERTQLMNNYRRVISELEQARQAQRVAADASNQLKLEHVLAQKRAGELEQARRSAETDAAQVRTDLRNLETQYNAVSRALAGAQRRTEQLECDQARAAREAAAARDLTESVDRGRDEASAQSAALAVELETRQREARAAESELRAAEARLLAETARADRLEALVAQTRERVRSLELQLAAREHDAASVERARDEVVGREQQQAATAAVSATAARRVVQLETENAALRSELDLSRVNARNRERELEQARERVIGTQQRLYALEEMLQGKERLVQRLLRKGKVDREQDSLDMQVSDAREHLLAEWLATRAELAALDADGSGLEDESLAEPASLLAALHGSTLDKPRARSSSVARAYEQS